MARDPSQPAADRRTWGAAFRGVAAYYSRLLHGCSRRRPPASLLPVLRGLRGRPLVPRHAPSGRVRVPSLWCRVGRGAFGCGRDGPSRRRRAEAHRIMAARFPIFDLDGTLLDTDDALVATFVTFGVSREPTSRSVMCSPTSARVSASTSTRSSTATTPTWPNRFPASPRSWHDSTVGRCARTSIRPRAAEELARLGWTPEVALFSDAFDGPKRLPPVLDALGLDPAHVVFIGDTAHDRVVAAELQVPFGLAAWNPRAVAAEGDRVLPHRSTCSRSARSRSALGDRQPGRRFGRAGSAARRRRCAAGSGGFGRLRCRPRRPGRRLGGRHRGSTGGGAESARVRRLAVGQRRGRRHRQRTPACRGRDDRAPREPPRGGLEGVAAGFDAELGRDLRDPRRQLSRPRPAARRWASRARPAASRSDERARRPRRRSRWRSGPSTCRS